MKLFFLLLCLCAGASSSALAQYLDKANAMALKMQHDLNLSDDQVSNIAQVLQRYFAASQDLQTSIDDGVMNPSAEDSQWQQIKAVKDQGIAQNLRPDQLNLWYQIQAREAGTKNAAGQEDGDVDMAGEDEYSNLPHNPSSK